MVAIQKLKVGLVAFLFLSLTGIPMVWADVGDPDSPWKRLTLKGGYFFANSDSTIRIDGATFGTEFDVEDVLGLDENIDSYDVGVKWRFFDRHSISVNYFDLTREKSTALNATITVGDKTFLINDVINTEFKWNTAAAFYTWSFLQTNKYEVGATIGAHITTGKFSLASLALNLGQVETKSLTLPLPTIGLTGAYAFTPKLILTSGAGLFALKIDDIKGSQMNFDLDLEYNAWKYIGFGIGYNFYRLDVNVDEDDSIWEAKYQYHGFKVFLKFYL